MLQNIKDQTDELILQHLYLVDIILRSWWHRPNDNPMMDYDDLYQIGCLALCKAAKNFDPSRHIQFKTFASVSIRHMLLDWQRDMIERQPKISDAPICDDEYLMPDDSNQLKQFEIYDVLTRLRNQYTGTNRKAIDALILRSEGHTNKNIAELFGVKETVLGAWCTRIKKELRKAPEILDLLGKSKGDKNNDYLLYRYRKVSSTEKHRRDDKLYCESQQQKLLA